MILYRTISNSRKNADITPLYTPPFRFTQQKHVSKLRCASFFKDFFPCFFLSCKANTRVKFANTGHGPHSSLLVVTVLFCCYFCCSMYCLWVNVYCNTATG
jgi:hypothetical protein